MVDRLFADPELAALYDVMCRGRPDFDFYLPLVMSAHAVLDVGCGTGELLRLARRAGHLGRLCGLDPAEAMLDQARAGGDIEWRLGDLRSLTASESFDLVVMTGHAFQVFVDDDEISSSLAAIRTALTDTGRFAFETRNLLVREWEHWTLARPVQIAGPDHGVVEYSRAVEAPAQGGLVRFCQTFTSTRWDGPKESWSTLRFLDAEALASFLSGAGLVVAEQYGDWSRGPLTATSPEIITIASPG